MSTNRVAVRLAISFLLFSLLVACNGNVPLANLQAAQSLGTAAASAREAYALVANDYQASCERTYRWIHLNYAEQTRSAHLKNTAVSAAAAKLAALAATLSNQAGANNNATLATIKALQAELPKVKSTGALPPPQDNCNAPEVVAAVTAWNGWNNLLLNFFVALGNLAAPPATDAFGLNAAAQSISGAVAGDPRLGPQANAVAQAATAVFGAIISAKESKAVAQYSTQDVSKLVDTTVSALISVEGTYVNAELFAEEKAIDEFYSNNLDAVPAGIDILGNLQTFLKDWSDQLDALEQRRTAAQSYVNSLNSLKNSYAAVVSASQGKPGDVALVSQYLTELQPSLVAIWKAFGPSSPSPAPAKGK